MGQRIGYGGCRPVAAFASEVRAVASQQSCSRTFRDPVGITAKWPASDRNGWLSSHRMHSWFQQKPEGVSKMLRISKIFAVLALCLGDQIVVAQEAPPTPALPKPINVTRFVPSGEGRTIGSVTALNPDCSSRGPIVGRVVEKPAHGEVSFEIGDIFPTYVQTSPLFVCNSKRTLGLMINYRSEQDFIGQDNMKVFLIFPDGSGAEWDYILIVK